MNGFFLDVRGDTFDRLGGNGKEGTVCKARLFHLRITSFTSSLYANAPALLGE